ncbi:hypothetical protein KXW60_007138 [Aspergillus fumigatus]|nr:hypothetical protein KXW88_002690 [Aspergillus fumigatus]KAH3017337.1 hypothetical protein KXW60_007138 [Aspergillus fumigatus]KAH3275696.1 hypothetical protein KXW55_006766 [Aspergillus fumigatus]KAJ8178084.1 hypothetical protein LV157_007772 [Aspergillus fumigatus]
MDRPKASEEAAPAYHELFDTELMNQPTATSSRTHQYAAVPDNDPDGNSYTADHHDVESHPQNSSNQLSQLDPTKPHFHCETCDRQLERRQKRDTERECCRMVALVFIVAIIFLTLLVCPADVEDTHTSHHTGFMDRMFHDRQDDNKQEQNEQHDQPPEVQPQQGTQPIPPVQEREGKSVEDYVDEERKLLQGGDTYSGLM